MLRGVLGWLTRRFRDEDDDGEQADDSRFIPSMLDASVRYAHGMGNTRAENELAQMEEQAQQLEEHHRDK